MLKPFYVIIATTEKDELKFVGKDESSGGYPYLSDYAQIFYDEKYFEGLKRYSQTYLKVKDFKLKLVDTKCI